MSAARRVRAGLALIVLALGLVLMAAAPASAHSTLLGADPAQGSELATAPARVTLTFSEAVGLAPDSVQVLDPQGHRVDAGAARFAGPDHTEVVVDLAPGLATASYAVLWHVASADTHPVSGSFSFGVGVPAGSAPAAQASDPAVSGVHWALVALWYLGAVVLVGTAVFVGLVWPAGRDRPAVRRLLWAGVGVSAVAVAGLYLLQGPYGQDRDLSAVTDLGLLRDTYATKAGPLLLERLLLVLLAIPVTGLWPRPVPPPGPGRGDAQVPALERPGGLVWQSLVLGAVLALTSALAGHPGQQQPVLLSAGVDAVHFLAAACWVGGLVCLAVAFLPSAGPDELAEVLPRWSRFAMVSVAALVLSGTYQAWQQIGSLDALRETDYGRLLLLKLGGLALLLALAELGRRWVRSYTARRTAAVLAPPGRPAGRHSGRAVADPTGTAAAPTALATAAALGPVPSPGRALRESVLAEVGVAVVVLGVTAALVTSVPARQAYAPPFSATIQARGVDGTPITVILDIPDTRPGVQTVHLYTYSAKGQVLPFVEVDGSLVEPSKKLGPVRFVFADTGPGHGTAEAVTVPGEGTWTLTLQVKTDDATAYAGTVSYPVRAG